MLKLKLLINVLLVLTILLCFHPIDNSIAGSCDEKASGGGTSTFTGNFNIPQGFECPENSTLEYDTVNSAATIGRNGSAALFVIGNNGPYTWSVSGTGFWFDAAYSTTSIQTTGVNVTVYADGSACGSGTITITGCDGTQVQGYVRCTTGAWGVAQTICELDPSSATATSVIIGDKRWTARCTCVLCTQHEELSCWSAMPPALQAKFPLMPGGSYYCGQTCESYCVSGTWMTVGSVIYRQWVCP